MLIWQAHKSKIESAAVSPDGQLLATATGSTRAPYLWEPTTGKLARKLEGASGAVKSVCAASATAENASSIASVWRPRPARILADNPRLMIWAARSSPAAATYRDQLAGFSVPHFALRNYGSG